MTTFHLITNFTRNALRRSALYNQQCRPYIPFPCHPRHQSTIKRGVSEAPHHSFASSALFRRFYSSKPSNSSTGFLNWYLGMLQRRPKLTKSISSAIIYGAADITSQLITMEPHDKWDPARTLRMAGFGLFILGSAQHMWFNYVGRVLPQTDVKTTFKKIAMGQLMYGPVINSIFFSFNAALQGEGGNDIVARLKRDLLPTLLTGLLYWPFCDFLTFKVIPVHLQPLVNSSFSYLWTIYLTYMASLQKAGPG